MMLSLFCRQLFLCVSVGLWAGLIIGFVTEYYTSNAYRFSWIINLLTMCLGMAFQLSINKSVC